VALMALTARRLVFFPKGPRDQGALADGHRSGLGLLGLSRSGLSWTLPRLVGGHEAIVVALLVPRLFRRIVSRSCCGPSAGRLPRPSELADPS